MIFEKAKEFILEKLDCELPKQLKYHNVKHTLDVYQAAIMYAELESVSPEDIVLLKTAALFHDAGYIIQAENHEVLSCIIAEESLIDLDYNKEQIQKIKGMIMATKIPQTPTNHLEEIIADADLDYLGRVDFEEISERLFQELKLSSRNEWNKIQISFFENHTYFTKSAKKLRNDLKQQNLQKINAQTQLY
jgi:predicted metal-dependent HD superfamily phosphohydrolase